ncbi:MAG TPA: LysR family transcriptional regulator [Solirubrobacterales bacterium]|nr:LysR family transcriptional regulator [Solirubrobacterales bacterium]
MLDVKRMRILREVAEHGSFSAAADSLHLTQSAVSQQIAALEREAGAQLIDRNRGNLRLTDPGEALVCHADAVLARLDEAERELREIAGLRGGRLRLVSFPTAGATVVIRAVAAFRDAHPEVDIQLAEAEPETSIPQLRAGQHDLALVYDYESVPLPEDRDVERLLLLEERMQLALPKGHPLAGQGQVKLSEMAEETWVIGTCTATCRDNVKLACRNAGFEPRIGFESDDYQVHQSLVAAGLAVSLVPELLLTGRHAGLAAVDIEPDAPVRRVWALTRPAEARSPAAGAMLEILAAECERFAAAR